MRELCGPYVPSGTLAVLYTPGVPLAIPAAGLPRPPWWGSLVVVVVVVVWLGSTAFLILLTMPDILMICLEKSFVQRVKKYKKENIFFVCDIFFKVGSMQLCDDLVCVFEMEVQRQS
jgi:hypothetical protein